MTTDAQIESLLEASCYPHGCGHIKLVETHISWVILTGNFAYKFKKPVDFGFLDFTNLQQRKELCHTECRLNRRYAPDLYLGVVALVETEAGLRLVDEPAEDNIIDYAVKMRQFDADQLYSHRLIQGQITELDMMALGEKIADFHNQLAPASLESEYGAPENILQPIEQNFVQMGVRCADESMLAQLEALKRWSINQFETLSPVFQQRKTQGFIRECHGDLHLGNIAQIDGKPVPFDGIEFNASLRWIDVINEIAFLVMDLEEHNQGRLANLFLNTYLEFTGDYEGVRLLTFYKVYRALVRAKVCLIRAEQEGLEGGQKEQLMRSFRNYLELAHGYTLPARQFLAITHGVSGTGKTTAARYVCSRTGAIHLRSDVERKRICGLSPRERSNSKTGGGIYTRDMTQKTFARLETLSRVLIKGGYSVVVDATFLHQPVRTHFFELARRLHMPFKILDCSLDEQTIRERLTSRLDHGRDASEATIAVMEQQVRDQDFLSEIENRHAIHLDTEKPLETQLPSLDLLYE